MDLEIAKPVFGDGSSAASIFSTGLGNTVAVSDESMRKGAALFSDQMNAPAETPTTTRYGNQPSGSMTKFTPIDMAPTPAASGSAMMAPSARSAAVDPKRLSFGGAALVTPKPLSRPPPAPRRGNQFRPPSQVGTGVANPPRTNQFRRNGKRSLLDCQSIDTKRQAVAPAPPSAAPVKAAPPAASRSAPALPKSDRVSLSTMRDQRIRCFPEPCAPRSEAPTEEIRELSSLTAKAFAFRSPGDLSSPALGGLSFSTIGPAELHMLLLRNGANAKLLSTEWVSWQYRWVVWKLAAYERRFPTQCEGALCVEEVLRQLERKYQCEMVAGRRPILRRIVEKDTHAGVHMILTVAAVSLDGDDTKIELTDGWYSVPAQLDQGLSEQAQRGRIVPGLKLRLCGSELTGLTEGVPILEIPATVVLKLNFNGCQRAPWDAKLGLQPNPTFRVALQSMRPDGGPIPCCEVLIQRHYPLRYLERLPTGSSVMRSEADEHKAASEHQEKAYQAMEKQREAQEKLQGKGEEMEPDGGFGDGFGGGRGGYGGGGYGGEASGLPDRDVRSLATLRVSDASYGDSCGRSRDDYRKSYLLSFWGGTEDTYGHMKDGSRHIGHNVNVRAARDGAVELSNKRETFFEEVKRPAAMQCYEPRCHTAFSALRQTALEDASETSGAAGGMREVDVVGLLLEAVPEEATGAHVFFLLDDSEQLVAVRSWHGNAKSLVPGSVLCATSVEWKSYDARHDVLHLHAGELSTFGVRAPRHLQEALAALTHWSKACPDAVERNQRRVQDLVAGRSTGAAADTTPGLATPAPSTRGGAKLGSQPPSLDAGRTATVCAFRDLQVHRCCMSDPASCTVREALPVAYFDPANPDPSRGSASRAARVLLDVREDFSTRRAWVPAVVLCDAMRGDREAVGAIRQWLDEVASCGTRTALAQRLHLQDHRVLERLLVALTYARTADSRAGEEAPESALLFSTEEWAAFSTLLSRHLEGKQIGIGALSFIGAQTGREFDDEFGSGSQLFCDAWFEINWPPAPAPLSPRAAARGSGTQPPGCAEAAPPRPVF